MGNPKPIFLLGDSQLLFWKDKKGLFLNKVENYLDKNKKIKNTKAAYIGASNGDDPAYFDIFIAAMEQIGIKNCRMVSSKPDTSDFDFLDLADLVLLAGGNVKKGWDIFVRNEFDKKIITKYYDGSILIGVSAGAVQIGLNGWDGHGNTKENIMDTCKIIPYIIDAHNEQNEWKCLKKAVEYTGEYSKGFGIPSGGGAIFYPDWSIEAIRHSLIEFFADKDKIRKSLILPPQDNDIYSKKELKEKKKN